MVVSGKKNKQYYLLLVWAAQSMFHIVANRNSAPRAVSSRPSRGWWVWVRPGHLQGVQRWPRVPLPPTISVNHCRRRGALVCAPRAARGILAALLNQSWQLWSFISVSFCLLGICTTHVVSVRFIYLWLEVPWLEGKGGRPVLPCRSLTWEELG